MATTNDNFSMDFSIQETSDTGLGAQGLLSNILEEGTASTKPEDITPIVTETEDKLPPTPKQKGKEITPPVEALENPEEDAANKGKNIIANFLGSEEEEGEAATTTEQTTFAPAGDDEEPDGNLFQAFAKDLFKIGAFTKEDEEEEDEPIANAEQFLERFEAEKKKGASQLVENFLSQFGEDYRRSFEAIYVNGADPKEYFETYDNVVNFAEMDLANEANQVKVMKMTLKGQGLDEEDAELEIERLKTYGDLADVSARHHKALIKTEAKKLEQIELKAKQDLQQKASVKAQFVQNVRTVLDEKLKAKEFDGIPLNPKIATELHDFLLVDKWRTPSGETLSDFDRTILDLKRPENHATKVKIALLLKILEKDPTLSTIQKTGVTRQTNVLFGEVARQKSKDKSTPAATTAATAEKTDSWFRNL